MTLTIHLSLAEEAQLSEAAEHTGLAPADLVMDLVREYLPVFRLSEESTLDAKLRSWQERDGTKLTEKVSAEHLFALWAQEDARRTHDAREAEDKLWDELEPALLGDSRGLHMEAGNA